MSRVRNLACLCRSTGPWALAAGFGALLASGAPGCLSFSSFACADDAQCDLEALGTCVPSTGFCAYPDLQCPDSMLRYDDGAGDGLGGECVGVGGSTTVTPPTGGGDTDSASGTDGETTDDPTNPVSTDPTMGDSTDSGDTVGACGGAGQECCPGDSCEAGLACAGSGCGCIAQIEAGTRHTCAIKHDGTVWCWGANDLGQSGQPMTDDILLPAQVMGGFAMSGATEISAANHTCALRADGSPECWGDNASQQVDPVNAAPVIDPVAASWSSPSTTVGVGASHTCAGREMEISVTCWGANGSGQSTSAAPGPGPFSASVMDFSPDKIEGGASHTCAKTATGQMFCWGANGNGQLGRDPLATPSSATPIAVPGLMGVGDIAVGANHTCARVGSDVMCWGLNTSGQLGDGTTTQATMPLMVPLPPQAGSVTFVEAGPNHTCVMAAGGTVWCWGSNNSGQLTGAETEYLDPFQIELDDPVLQLTTGGTQTCVLTDRGEALCWGINQDGQNGDGTTNYGFFPTPVDLQCP